MGRSSEFALKGHRFQPLSFQDEYRRFGRQSPEQQSGELPIQALGIARLSGRTEIQHRDRYRVLWEQCEFREQRFNLPDEVPHAVEVGTHLQRALAVPQNDAVPH